MSLSFPSVTWVALRTKQSGVDQMLDPGRVLGRSMVVTVAPTFSHVGPHRGVGTLTEASGPAGPVIEERALRLAGAGARPPAIHLQAWLSLLPKCWWHVPGPGPHPGCNASPLNSSLHTPLFLCHRRRLPSPQPCSCASNLQQDLQPQGRVRWHHLPLHALCWLPERRCGQLPGRGPW